MDIVGGKKLVACRKSANCARIMAEGLTLRALDEDVLTGRERLGDVQLFLTKCLQTYSLL
jgi:hypothetical protein